MNHITVNADDGKHTISRHIYGHFAEHLGRCIYGGFWVGEDSDIAHTRGIRSDVVEALRAINIPNLRWPGGCFADEYHWRDGIGPRSERPSMINTHWGGVTENNHFGTHEFLDLCEQLGCEPYICGNVGSGTVLEMQRWVEYLTYDGDSPTTQLRRKHGRAEPWSIKFWGVGNESWGCGGSMHPAYYANEFRRFQTYLRDFGGNKLYKIACGANSDDYEWTEVLMQEVRDRSGRYPLNGLSLHHYALGSTWPPDRAATGFDEAAWIAVLADAARMDELLIRHISIMDSYDPENSVNLIVDEWGSWYRVETGTNPGFLYQQNTLRDAFVAALTLDIFNRHGERVKMANIAQTVNVLQAPILTEEGGERLVLTPTYHVFDMYKGHQDATLLPLKIQSETYSTADHALPSVSGTASRDAVGTVHLTLSNVMPHRSLELSCHLRGFSPKTVTGQILTAQAIDAHNSFETPTNVIPRPFEGVHLDEDRLSFTLPAMAIVALTLS